MRKQSSILRHHFQEPWPLFRRLDQAASQGHIVLQLATLVVGLSFLELVKIQKDTKMMAKPKSQPIRRCLMVSQSASILLCLVMPCPGRFPPAKGGLNPPGPLGAGALDAITGPPGTVRFKKRPSNGMLVLKASNDIG